MAGKGDHPRPVDREKWEKEGTRLFGERIIKTWDPEEDADENASTMPDVRDDGDEIQGVQD